MYKQITESNAHKELTKPTYTIYTVIDVMVNIRVHVHVIIAHQSVPHLLPSSQPLLQSQTAAVLQELSGTLTSVPCVIPVHFVTSAILASSKEVKTPPAQNVHVHVHVLYIQ